MKNKHGFHTGTQGNNRGWTDWWQALNAAGISVYAASADEAGVLYEIQQGGFTENILTFRKTTVGNPGDNFDYDSPRIANQPETEAQAHFWKSNETWPPELDFHFVFRKVLNEINTKPADDETVFENLHIGEWFGRYGLEYGRLILDSNRRAVFFSCASGTPEPDFWQQPSMVEFLRLCIANPDHLHIGLHEYSYVKTDIYDGFPYKVGRFQSLFQICDDLGLNGWPRIQFVEWGWEERHIPDVEPALDDIDSVNQDLYLQYHDYIAGMGIWYLGGNYGDIHNQTQRLIQPLTQMTLDTEWQVEKRYPKMSEEPNNTLSKIHHSAQQRAFPVNENAALQSKALADGYAPAGEEKWETIDGFHHANQPFFKWNDTNKKRTYYAAVGDWDNVRWTDGQSEHLVKVWPTDYKVVTQRFMANPQNYIGFDGLFGHDGIDIRAPHGTPIYACYDGTVSAIRNNPQGHNYGIYVRVLHDDGIQEFTYAHNQENLVALGERVTAGQQIAKADNTGNSFGSHLHITYKRKGETFTDDCGNQWAHNIFPCDHLFEHFDGVQWPTAVECYTPDNGGGEMINIRKYFEPAGEHGEYVVFHLPGRTQPQQMQKVNDYIILWKGEGQWFDGQGPFYDYEQWRFKDGQLQRNVDTSDSGNGGRDAYSINWTQWLPENVEIGKVYESRPTVTRKNRTNCQLINESATVDYLYVKEIVPNWVSPANNQITYQNVLVIEWRKTADINTPPIEVYSMAENVAYCGWNNGSVGERPQGRTPLTGVESSCFG